VSQHPSSNTAIVCALAVSLFGLTVLGAETPHDFSRYQVIVDRSPFGPMSGVGPEVAQPPFSARYTFVGTAKLDETQPLMAIILDKEGSRTYFKSEGETIGDATVFKIDKEDKGPVKLVLKQGLEVATLVMETKASVGAAPPAPSAQPQPFIPGQSAAPVPPQPGVRRIPFRRGG
jgi:hypothetical protein